MGQFPMGNHSPCNLFSIDIQVLTDYSYIRTHVNSETIRMSGVNGIENLFSHPYSETDAGINFMTIVP